MFNACPFLFASSAERSILPHERSRGPGMTTPLAGITVLDFGQIYQGPYATFLMAKAGATVIKIEPPAGEPLTPPRHRDRRRHHVADRHAERQQESVTLNLKSDQGKELLRQMVRRADVLLENFSPGTMDQLGVGYAVLREINPQADLCDRHGLRPFPARIETTSPWTSPSSSLRHHERHRRSFRAADEAGPTVVDFMGGVAPLRRSDDSAYQRMATGLGNWSKVADAGDGLIRRLPPATNYYRRTGNPPPRAGTARPD